MTAIVRFATIGREECHCIVLSKILGMLFDERWHGNDIRVGTWGEDTGKDLS